MKTKHYTIDKVGWHTKTQGNPETKESIDARFKTICSFLNENSMTVTDIFIPKTELSDGFELTTNQLTEQGMEYIKRVYDKWLKRIDNGASPLDTTYLTKQMNQNGI